jgi:hypothetical protein
MNRNLSGTSVQGISNVHGCGKFDVPIVYQIENGQNASIGLNLDGYRQKPCTRSAARAANQYLTKVKQLSVAVH